MSSDTMVQTEEQVENLSAIQKIIGVFTSPAKTFASLDLNPTWILPLIVIAAINLVFVFTAKDILLQDTLTQQEEKMIERGMDAEQMDQALAATEKFMQFGTPVFAIVMPLLITVIVAAVFLFVGNVLLGGKTSFKKMFSMTAHSWLVPSVGALIILPIVLSKKTMMVTFSLASLLPDSEKTTFLYQLLAKIDIFMIAWIAVFSIGMAVLYKLKTSKAAMAVVGVYAIYAIVASSLTGLFS